MIDQLESLIEQLKELHMKKPTKVGYTRQRAILLKLKKHCDKCRKECLQMRKDMPVKAKKKIPAKTDK